MTAETPTFGRYLVEEQLATGGMAEVFLARLPGPANFSKKVVIKRIRPELAEREEREIEFIRVYLPEPLSDEDLQALIAAAIATAGATSMKDMGKVMGLVKAEAQGRADMGKVSAAVKERLSAA